MLVNTAFNKHLLTLIRDDLLCSMVENIKHFNLKILLKILQACRSQEAGGTVGPQLKEIASWQSSFSFPLLVKARPGPSRAMPRVLGAPSNINSIQLKMEQSPDSSRQEACWGLGSRGQAETGTRSCSTSQGSCKPKGPVSRLTGAGRCW